MLGLHESATLYDVDLAGGEAVKARTVDAAGRELIEDTIAYYNGADRLYRSGAYSFLQKVPVNYGGAAWPRYTHRVALSNRRLEAGSQLAAQRIREGFSQPQRTGLQ